MQAGYVGEDVESILYKLLAVCSFSCFSIFLFLFLIGMLYYSIVYFFVSLKLLNFCFFAITSYCYSYVLCSYCYSYVLCSVHLMLLGSYVELVLCIIYAVKLLSVNVNVSFVVRLLTLMCKPHSKE